MQCSGDSTPFPIPLTGICGSGDPIDQLSRGHSICLSAATCLADLSHCLGLLALHLWPLESCHDHLPLLYGHHYSAWLPSSGRAEGLIVLLWPLLLFTLGFKTGLLAIISCHFLSVVTPGQNIMDQRLVWSCHYIRLFWDWALFFYCVLG